MRAPLEKHIAPKGKRTKPMRMVAVFDNNADGGREVDQALCRHLLKFGFFCESDDDKYISKKLRKNDPSSET